MFDLFTQTSDRRVTGSTHPQWEYFRRVCLNNLQKYKDYYRTSAASTNASHLLTNLLGSLGIPMSLTPESYRYAVERRSTGLAMTLGLCSEAHQGRVQASQFLKGTAEVIIVNSSEFDADKATKEWREIRAVTFLRHPYGSLDLPHPFAVAQNGEYGTTVVNIDLTLLAIQYRAFCLEEAVKETSLSLQNFCVRWVWPNAMPSYMEQAWLNRVIACSEKRKPRENLFPRHPFVSVSLSHGFEALDQIAVDAVAWLGKQDYLAALKTIPGIEHPDAYSALALPDYVPTTQLTWATCLARLPHAAFLSTTNDGALNHSSKEAIVQMVRTIERNYVSRFITQLLPDAAASQNHLMIGDLLRAQQES